MGYFDLERWTLQARPGDFLALCRPRSDTAHPLHFFADLHHSLQHPPSPPWDGHTSYLTGTICLVNGGQRDRGSLPVNMSDVLLAPGLELYEVQLELSGHNIHGQLQRSQH